MMPLHAALFLVSKIADRATRENITPSDVERNILLFFEMSPTLSNMAEINEAFERKYDRLEYEKKIEGLTRQARAAALQYPAVNEAWRRAVTKLRSEDYYVLAILNESSPIYRGKFVSFELAPKASQHPNPSPVLSGANWPHQLTNQFKRTDAR